MVAVNNHIFVISIILYILCFIQVNNAEDNVALPQPNSRSHVGILVIGGGISGLVASARLRNLGYNVTLLEASDRVGGRIHTQEFGSGQYVEMGAEWIHGETYNKVYQLMEQLEVLVSDDIDGIYIFANQSGGVMNTKFNKEIYNLATAIREGEDVDDSRHNMNTSVGEMANRIFRSFIKGRENPFHYERPCLAYAALDWIHRNTNLEDSADDWFQTSAIKDLVATTSPGNQGVYWRRPYTYTTLLKYVMTGELEDRPLHVQFPNWIHLGKEVTQIQYFTDDVNMNVKVLCKDGTHFNADHVISTVSLGVLKERHLHLFNPTLSIQKQLAIQHLGFGSVNKIYLNFEAPFWLNRTAEDYDDQEDPNVQPDEILDGLQFLWEESRNNCSLDSYNETMLYGHWARNASRSELLKEHDGIPEWSHDLAGLNTIRNHPTAMQAYVIGSSARLVETLKLEEIEEVVMRLLRRFGSRIFKKIPKPINITMSKWHSNPFIRGSYSFRTVNSDIYQVFAEDLAIPIENVQRKPIICFAGEATHPKYYSHVHGAFDTGLREAERIHKFYKTIMERNGSIRSKCSALITVSCKLYLLLVSLMHLLFRVNIQH